MPLLDQPVGNEASWWANHMRLIVAADVARQLLLGAGERLTAESPAAWRDRVTDAVARITAGGGTPVLLFGRDWPFGRNDEEDDVGQAIYERLTTGEPRAQVLARTAFLDRVTIRRLPVQGPTLLAPAEMFRRLRFGRDAYGRLVTVGFEPGPDGATTGVLTASASFALDLDRPERAFVITATAGDGTRADR